MNPDLKCRFLQYVDDDRFLCICNYVVDSFDQAFKQGLNYRDLSSRGRTCRVAACCCACGTSFGVSGKSPLHAWRSILKLSSCCSYKTACPVSGSWPTVVGEHPASNASSHASVRASLCLSCLDSSAVFFPKWWSMVIVACCRWYFDFVPSTA